MARLSGDHAFYRMFTQHVIPDLKRMGKYHALSANFIDDPKSFIAGEQIVLADATDPSAAVPGCTAAGELLHVGPDERANWNLAKQPKLNLVWAYGYAIGPDCRKPVDFVFIADARQTVLCVSRPGRPMMSDLPPPAAAALSKHADAVFDFSCPLPHDYETGKPYNVYTWTRSNRALTKFDGVGRDGG
jgi:hypothetical protein